MFERRLKILFLLLLLAAGGLVVRAFSIQVVSGGRWAGESAKAMRDRTLIDAPRGRLLDFKGREIAVDRPCIDVRVDYRAIAFEPDAKWLRDAARVRLKRRDEQWAQRPRTERAKLLVVESEAVRRDVDRMWQTLARVANRTDADVRQQRQAIVDRVTKIKAIVRAAKQREIDAQSAAPAPWYVRWFGGNREDAVAEVELGEERAAHVIVPDISYADYAELAKRAGTMPGLELRSSLRRTYPYGPAAAQVLGRMGAVDSEDINADPNAGDRLREYADNDTRGKAGLEAMLEQTLRGSRGTTTVKSDGDGGEAIEQVDMRPGGDARVTIDIELQKSIEAAFNHVTFSPSNEVPPQEIRMNGAAVVIDVATGEVRAMVSAPGYDPNTLDRTYNALVTDNVNDPLLNRATMVAREPGSTVKLIVGLGAITDGLIGPLSRIECDGYLHAGGRPQQFGRCWTMSQFGIAHHQTSNSPHPTGMLDFPEAIERSCNVFFESLGDRYGIEGLRPWFERFGLGSPTGVGLPEARGRLPDLDTPAAARRSTAWFAAIGQGQMAATPIQLANLAATIARDGTWVRPTLVPRDEANAGVETQRHSLNLNPAAVALAQQGMANVVNGRAGTGTYARLDDLEVTGKTGSAQASPLKLIRRDATGKPLLDARGRRIYEPVTLGTTRNINPLVPWYRAIGRDENTLPAHAWTIGFAPRHDPKIAYAVLVEYGGSGGQAAGSVAKKVLEACQREGYLPTAN